MKNKELFSDYLLQAIGDMSQAEFARRADISRYGLCKFLNGNSDHTPTERTLRKIAEASEGRVTFEELLYASGRVDGVIEKAKDIVRIIDAFARIPVRWERPTFAEEKIKSRYPSTTFSYEDPTYIPRESTLTGNAEKAVACKMSWDEKGERYNLGVILFYCCTTGGGYIPFGCEANPDRIHALGYFKDKNVKNGSVLLWKE